MRALKPPFVKNNILIYNLLDPKRFQARGHDENEAVRSYGLFLTALYDRWVKLTTTTTTTTFMSFRFTLFDGHIQALARRVENMRYCLYTFIRVHNGLVEGTGVESFR